MKNIAVYLISYDGIVNNYCGLGTSTRSFIKSFMYVHDFMKKSDIDLSLHLVTQALLPESLGYSENIKNESMRVTRETGGEVHFIGNASDGMIPYGRLDNWKAASENAATVVLNQAKNFDESIVFCFDTPYARVPYNISMQKKAYGVDNITSVIVLESDVFIHEPENPSIERIAWEASSLKQAEFDDSIIIANTGKFITNHLVKHYGLDASKFVDLVQGVDPSLSRYDDIPREKVMEVLKQYGIPLDKKLIFSVGRAVDYKGFDLLIEAASKLKEEAHLVFVASPYKTEATFVDELKRLLEETKLECTAIFDCDFKLPSYICQWENTKLVVQLSRREPFGLVPEEVRVWSKDSYPMVLVSNKDGFVEQITDGVDGFLVNLDDTKVIAEKMDSILRLSDDEAAEIVAKGKNKFEENFDYRKNLYGCFKQLLKDENPPSMDEFTNWLNIK